MIVPDCVRQIESVILERVLLNSRVGFAQYTIESSAFLRSLVDGEASSVLVTDGTVCARIRTLATS
jgi:hypothetical protein